MQVSKKWQVAISIVGVFMVVMGFITRAWVHDIFMIAYVNPFPTLVGLLAIGFLAYDLIGSAVKSRYNEPEPSWITWVAVAAIALVTIGYAVLEPWYYGKALYNQTNFETVQKMPQTNPVMPRVLPFTVANKYADDSFDEPTEKLGTNHLQVVDGKLVNVLPQVPEGTILYFTNHMSGVKLVDSGIMDKSIKTVSKEVAVSENVGITDNIYWQIYNHDYWVDVREVLYTPYQNEIYVVVPYMKYTGFFVRVPYFAGVYVFDSAGNMRNYSPEEAAKLPFIKGNRVYPEWLVRQQVESYQFAHGIRNYLFFHKDQIEVNDPTGNNPYPYLLPVKTGSNVWMIPAQPRGQSFALMKVFFADAVTGKMQVYSVPKKSNLTGAEKALGYVKQALPTVSWSDFSVEEPRPVIPGDTLWWMASVVPKDYSGISRTVFINTKTNEVRVCENLNQVMAFINGQTTQALLANPGLTTNIPASTVSTSNPSVSTTSTEAVLKQIEHIKTELSALENSIKK